MTGVQTCALPISHRLLTRGLLISGMGRTEEVIEAVAGLYLRKQILLDTY